MTEPLYGLRTLVELPPSAPPPVEDLRRRAAARHRRRRMSHVSLAGVAVVLAGVAVVPLVDRPSDAPTQVVAAATGMSEVARASAGGSTLVLQADDDCAYLRWAGAQPGDAALAGGCGAPPTTHFVETFGAPVQVSGELTAAILHAGPSIARFSVRLADDRTIEGAMGAHGWALVVADGPIVGVSGIDPEGQPVPEWVVG